MRFCPGKAVNGAYSESAFVTLGVQNALRLRRIVFFGLSGCTIFSTLSHERHDFGKRLLNIKY